MFESHLPINIVPHERYDYFTSLVDELFCPMLCEPQGGSQHDFRGAVETTDLGNVRIARVSTSPVRVSRRKRDIARVSDARYLIKFQLQGEAFWSQLGKDVHLRPGDFVICSTAEPYSLRFDGPYQMPVIAITDTTMNHLTPHPEQFLGRRMPGEDASCGLLSSFVGQVVSKMSELPPPMAERVETNILDLLGGVLSAHSAGGSSGRLTPARQLDKMKGFIRENLRNRRLGPSMLAEAFGVSTRYVHKVFSVESMTLTRFIRMQRLEACRQSLADPASQGSSITEIALYWGFYDLSHMTRSFGDAYGATPTSYRLEARKKIH